MRCFDALLQSPIGDSLQSRRSECSIMNIVSLWLAQGRVEFVDARVHHGTNELRSTRVKSVLILAATALFGIASCGASGSAGGSGSASNSGGTASGGSGGTATGGSGNSPVGSTTQQIVVDATSKIAESIGESVRYQSRCLVQHLECRRRRRCRSDRIALGAVARRVSCRSIPLGCKQFLRRGICQPG